jgi:hypothetical protein
LILQRLLADAEDEVILPASAQSPGAQASAAGGPAPQGTTAQQLAAARNALTAFELRLTPEHPDVGRTKALIATLETKLAAEMKAAADAQRAAAEAAAANAEPSAPVLDPREVARRDRIRQLLDDIENIDREIARKEAEEERVRLSIEALQARIEGVPGIESEWIALTRDYNTQSQSYNELLAKSDDAQLAANLEERQIGEQFRILDPARVPVRPVGVDRLQINVMGAAGGLGFGLLLAGLLELRDRSFRRPDEIVDVLKLPVVALVPQVVSDVDRRRGRVKTLLLGVAASLALAAGAYGFWTMRLWNYVV